MCTRTIEEKKKKKEYGKQKICERQDYKPEEKAIV